MAVFKKLPSDWRAWYTNRHTSFSTLAFTFRMASPSNPEKKVRLANSELGATLITPAPEVGLSVTSEHLATSMKGRQPSAFLLNNGTGSRTTELIVILLASM